MLETAEERIRAAGDRDSKIIQAFYHEFGNITRQDACKVIGYSSATVYREAERIGLVLKKGCRAELKEGSIAFKRTQMEAITS
jgi:hypothetical protein